MLMSEEQGIVDYTDWDWLPQAADEIQAYLKRLLDESAVTAHDVSARAKSIASFNRKQNLKQYIDPKKQVTDTVAVRIITYSVTDRNRAAELIRGRFHAHEDRNPGDEKDDNRRGYDCHHFIVQGELPDVKSGWLVAGGKLARYFENFGGLEIQIRTVAAHAWAEFEHSRRYKGHPYGAISDKDRQTVDIVFGAAADARRALDEAFIVIDRILASPTGSSLRPYDEDYSVQDISEVGDRDLDDDNEISPTPVNPESLKEFLTERFPDDEEPSHEGMQFACDLVDACGLPSIGALENALKAIDSARVRELMDTTTTVTRVRRLDDELLARFGESYIRNTGTTGKVKTRDQQLEWRYDRLRDKVPFLKYNLYELVGNDSPEEFRGRRLSAARAVREVARVVAELQGSEAVNIQGEISRTPEDILGSARAKEVSLVNGERLWVATNRDRESSERLLMQLLRRAEGLDLRVEKEGNDLDAAA